MRERTGSDSANTCHPTPAVQHPPSCVSHTTHPWVARRRWVRGKTVWSSAPHAPPLRSSKSESCTPTWWRSAYHSCTCTRTPRTQDGSRRLHAMPSAVHRPIPGDRGSAAPPLHLRARNSSYWGSCAPRRRPRRARYHREAPVREGNGADRREVIVSCTRLAVSHPSARVPS